MPITCLPFRKPLILSLRKRNRQENKDVQAGEKNGSIVEFPRQNETTLSRWIEGRIRRNGKILQEMPMRSLSVKPVMTWKISTKSWKTSLLHAGKDYIDISDVEAITTEQTENKIFDMIDAVALHQQKRHWIFIMIFLLSKKLRCVFFSAFQPVSASDDCQIHDQSGIWQQRNCFKSRLPGVGSPQIPVAEPCFSMDQLKQAIRDGVEYETAVKTGHMNDQMAVELFLVQYSAGK